MTLETRRLAGVLLILVPTVAFGGVSLLRLLIDDPAYADNPLRQDLWRAGHAHAGVLLVLSLVVLPYVDQTRLSGPARAVARHGVPVAAILLPAAMFLSVLDADATTPNPLIHLAWPGALSLAAGVVTLGVGLIEASRPGGEATRSRDPAGRTTAEPARPGPGPAGQGP